MIIMQKSMVDMETQKVTKESQVVLVGSAEVVQAAEVEVEVAAVAEEEWDLVVIIEVVECLI